MDLFVTFLNGFLSLIGSQRFLSLLVEGVDLVEKEECLQVVEEEEEGEDLGGRDVDHCQDYLQEEEAEEV